MSWDPAFESAFHPKVVAIVGISAKARLTSPGGTGFLNTYQKMGFTGKIYLVNVNATEILGYKAYPSVSAIPEPVDLVIITAPAKAAPEILEDCIAANVKNVHLFTAGFEETGLEEGKELGKRVREIALRGGIRLIGPNCMGLYVPASRIGYLHVPPVKAARYPSFFRAAATAIGFPSTGPTTASISAKASATAMAMSSTARIFWNTFPLTPETGIICMYLEGVRDGRRLLRLVREINPQKPVIIWKGGLTEAGSRAASSHTGSLVGQAAVWQALFAQTGAVQVSSLEEMAETTMTFLCLKKPAGKRVGVIGMGGGVSVYAADACGREGLELPALSQHTRDELKTFISEAGGSTKNPVDCGAGFVDVSLLATGDGTGSRRPFDRHYHPHAPSEPGPQYGARAG